MTIILAIISLILLIVLGFLFLNLFQITNFEKLGLSYLIGVGLFTFLLFALYTFGIRFTLVNSIIVYIVSTLILLTVNIKLGRLKLQKLSTDIVLKTPLEKLLGGIILVIFISVLISSFYWPISSWDSIALYDYRSKIFVQTGGFNAFTNLSYDLVYPLLTSLAQYWMYIFGATTAMPIHAGFYVFFVISAFAIFKRLSNTALSLMFALFIALSPELFLHGHLAYTNLPYSSYIVLGSVYVYLFSQKRHYSDLIIGAILIGLSTWCRTTEPFWIIPLGTVILFSLINKKIKPSIIYAAIFFCIQLPWRNFHPGNPNQIAYNPVSEISYNATYLASHINFEVIKSTAVFLWENVFNYYLIFFLIPILIFIKKIINKELSDLYFPLILLGYFGILITGTYVFALTQSYWDQIPGSAMRMMLFWPQLAIFFLAITISEKIK